MEIASVVFLVIGGLFLFLGGLGVFRMPDTLNRIQAGTKATTLGVFSTLIGVGLYSTIDHGFTWILKIVLIIFFIILSNPIGSSALAKASIVAFGKPSNVVLDEMNNAGGNDNVSE
jgi:multicomponent Na+:H+ antiporter subunit G